MQAIGSVLLVFSILFPSKTWYAPDQSLNVQVKGAGGDVTLVMLDFMGKVIESDAAVQVRGDRTVDLKQFWGPQLRTAGTYLLIAVPSAMMTANREKAVTRFVGTPLVIGVREDTRRDAPPGPMVVKVEPLQFAVISTDKGDMTAVFYYDVAPDTVANFLSLAAGGFYDGLTFHRVVPGFVIQTGDPRGDGTGGPGYHIEAEFNGREHREGVLSMARQEDPVEKQGAMPRADAMNSAGSQFFICLNYARTMQLNNRYTAFGKIAEGMDTVNAIAGVPTDPKTDRPKTPLLVKSVRLVSVTADNDPYTAMFSMMSASTTAPAPAPTTAPASAPKAP